MSSNKIQPFYTVINVLPSTYYKFGTNSFPLTATTFNSRKSHKQKDTPLTLKAIQNWFMQNLRNYCNTTSLHSFNYFTRADMTQKKRYFWLFVVIVSIIVSIVLVKVSYLWNREMPTVTVIESSHHPTWDIPFLAITFCNFNKISRDKALSLVKFLKRPSNTSEEEVLRSFHVTMYYSFALNQSNVNFTLAEEILDLNNMSLTESSERLMPNCLDMISKCVWKGTNSRCDSLFQRIPTIDGDCCSFNYFGQAKNNFPEFLWIVFIFAVIIWTHFIILTLIMHYIQQPTEVKMSTNRVHVSRTPFPGVAVCSANKLSRTKVVKFAEKLFEQQQLYKPYYVAETTQEMAEHLLNFKGFYIFPHDDQPLNFTLLYRLDKIFNFMFNSTKYPFRDYLKSLAPDCENLIIRGTIYGQDINTSDYFIKRLTSSSVCCMFNYNRRGYSIDPERRKADDRFADNAEKNIKFESNSILNSIQFLLRSDSEDFTITEFHNAAFQLFIFPRDDYATIQSNRIGEILVDYNTIVEVPIEPEFFSSTHRVRQFAPHVRNCYFPDEGQKLLNQSYYSIDECLLLCRMESMIKYCGCVTPPMVATNKQINYCSFSNLPCLMKWKAVWYGWVHFEYVHENGKDLNNNFTTGHRCPQCLPNCNGVDYNLEVNEMIMSPAHGKFYSHGILEGLTNAKPLAIVKLYFKQRYVLATEMDIVGDWVVLLNRFGGIMSLMYGFSIISYIEIVYFATGKFFAYHLDSWKIKLELRLSTLTSAMEKEVEVNGEDKPPPAYNICWRELKPKQLVNVEILKHDIILHSYNRGRNNCN